MNPRSTQTYREIMNQPDSWAQTVAAVTGNALPLTRLVDNREELVCIGCGSSYYLSTAAAGLWEAATGLPARAYPAGSLLLTPEEVLHPGRRTLVVGFSRSGETTETVQALEMARRRFGATAVAVTCHRGGAMVAHADAAIELPWADDSSIVMTQSFTNMLLGMQAWSAAVGDFPATGDELTALPRLAREGLPAWDRLAETLAADRTWSSAVFFGTGAYYGLANEAALKLKETSQAPAEAYHPLEFRHGPISTVTSGLLAILFARDRAAAEADVLADVAARGARVLRVGTTGADIALAQGTDLGDWARAALYLPFPQLLAVHRSSVLGLDPDRPRNLSRVVHLQDAELNGRR